MTAVWIALGLLMLLLLAAIVLIVNAIVPAAMNASFGAYVYAARLLGDGLAEALSRKIWASRTLLVALYAMRGAVTAVLVWLTAVQLVKSPESSLTVVHAVKVGFTMGGLYVLALLTRACIRAESMIQHWRHLQDGSIVLFLRSFPSDSSISDPTLVIGAPGYSEEQAMAALFGTVARVVALARPRAAPELGAIRVSASDMEWRATLTSLVSRAKVVVVRLGASEGLIWELQLLASMHPRLPALFLLPEVPEDGEKDVYPTLAAFLNENTGWSFPPTRDKESFLFFRPAGDAVLLQLCRRRDLYRSLTPFFETFGLSPKQITPPRMVLEQLLLTGVILYFALIMLLLSTVGLPWGV